MFKMTLPAVELYDEATQTFVNRDETVMELEHSLLSISKWESYYEKPFLTNDTKTLEEERYYVMCMDTKGNITDNICKSLSTYELSEIRKYMSKSCTATTINSREKQSKSRDILTSEVIYYMMIAMEVPIECERWNINRLLMLIRVCAVKNNPKKMGMKDIMRDNAALNKMRRASMGTKG